MKERKKARAPKRKREDGHSVQGKYARVRGERERYCAFPVEREREKGQERERNLQRLEKEDKVRTTKSTREDAREGRKDERARRERKGDKGIFSPLSRRDTRRRRRRQFTFILRLLREG